MQGKNGAVLLAFVVFFGFILALIVFFAATKTSNPEIMNYGLAQLQLMSTYQKGERALTFIDLTAKLAMQQSAFDLANDMKTDCGSHNGYALWYSDGKECYPTTAAVNNYYLTNVSSIMDNYFEKYEDIKIPKDNYDFTVSSSSGRTEIVGRAKKPLVIEVKNEAS